MTRLVAGQNIPWAEPRLTAYLDRDGVGCSVLLLGDRFRVRGADDLVTAARPSRSGVEWLAGPPEGVTVDLGGVDADVQRVLLVAGGESGVRLLGTDGDVVATFAPDVTGSELALLELYRRDGGWRVRAVGQAYSGGLPGAYAAHGLSAPARPAPLPSGGSGARPVEELLRHSMMVLEDASRTTASLRSTRDFARAHWERELEDVVADPALRVGEVGEQARRAAEERHRAMVGEAEQRHRRDLDQLAGELHDFEAELPAPLASWESGRWADWQPPDDLQRGIRVGELALPDAPLFRMPLLLPVPLSRPLWIDVGADDAVATVILRALAIRVLAATAPAGTRVTLVDLGGRRGRLGLPDALLDGPPAVDAADAAARLEALVGHLELLGAALASSNLDALDEAHRGHRLLLVTDLPTGLDESTLLHLLAVIEHGPALGVHVLVTGSHTESLGIGLIDQLHARFLRLPSAPGGDLVDGFGRVDWAFLPDPGPSDDAILTQVLDRLVLARSGAG